MDTLQISATTALRTSRLLLRDFRDDDTERIIEYFGEPEAQPFVLRSQRRPEAWPAYMAAATRYARTVPLSSRPDLGLAVALCDTQELIGMCSLSGAHPDSSHARIGWHFSRKFSGLGYATETGRELIRFAFEERRVACVYGDCYASNTANLRVFVKLGMRPWRGPPLSKWLLALKYRELKPIVRYAIDNPETQ